MDSGWFFLQKVKFDKVSDGWYGTQFDMLRLAVDAFVHFGMPNCQKSKRAQNGPYLATFGLLTDQMVIYIDQLDWLTAGRTLWSHSKYFCHIGGQKSTKNVILRCKLPENAFF